MSNEVVSLQVSQELVKPILEAKIAAAVCEAMQGQEAFLQAIVARVLNQKVNEEGKVDSYLRSDSPKYVQWLAEQAIKEATKKAVLEWIERDRPKIVKAVELALRKDTSKIAQTLVDYFAGQSPDYRMVANISFRDKL